MNHILFVDKEEDPIIGIGENYVWAQASRVKDINLSFASGPKQKGWRKRIMQTALYLTTGNWPLEVRCV
jgi:hypothetical protein